MGALYLERNAIMAPDYDKPPHNLAVSNLFRSLHPKLKDYISPANLYDQLCLAYYTYEPGGMPWDSGTDDLSEAFTWAFTFQGSGFWEAIWALEEGHVEDAIEKLEEELQ